MTDWVVSTHAFATRRCNRATIRSYQQLDRFVVDQAKLPLFENFSRPEYLLFCYN